MGMVLLTNGLLHAQSLDSMPWLSKVEPKEVVEPAIPYLHDTAGIMERGGERELKGFLDYHAKKSSIDLYVVIPSEAWTGSDQFWEDNGYAGANGIAIVYELGDPEGAQVLYSGDDALINEELIQAMRESSVKAALAAEDPTEQLGRYVEDMSSNLDWIEHAMVDANVPDNLVLVTGRGVVTPMDRAIQLAWISMTSMLITAATLFVILRVRHNKRLSLSLPVKIPDVEIHLRMGAPCGGGGQASISFGQPGESSAAWRLIQNLKRRLSWIRVLRP